MAQELAISIHALLAESDNPKNEKAKTSKKFLSTLSLRRATPFGVFVITIIKFLSTLSLRRATRYSGLFDSFDVISIHALLAESDAIRGIVLKR